MKDQKNILEFAKAEFLFICKILSHLSFFNFSVHLSIQ
jgi:hypothetical protein